MASVFKKSKRKGAPYYIDYFDEHGRRRRERGCADKAATEQIARKLEAEVELRRRGIIDAEDDARAAQGRRPLSEHLTEFKAHLLAKGGTPSHAELAAGRVARVVALVRGAALANIDPPRTATRTVREEFAGRLAMQMEAARLGDLTRDSIQAALAALRAAGRSAQTANHHRAALKAFCRWALKGRLRADPTAGVVGYNVAADRRHDRRTISVEELCRLVEVAHYGAPFRKMTGPARSLCYRLAAATGLRFKEIASITPESFDLGEHPTVRVAGAYTKNGEPATLDLPPDVADDLARFVAGLPAGAAVFPLPLFRGRSDGRGAMMLRRDLEAAGIPYRDAAGLVFDFHSLRCEHATLLDLAGISPRVAQKKMRHSTLEQTGRYTRPRAVDLERATASLPCLRPAGRDQEALAATGTDPPAASATPGATQAAVDGCSGVAADDLASGRLRFPKPQAAGSNPAGRNQSKPCRTRDLRTRPAWDGAARWTRLCR
jgi:integrase